ncbi:MAG: putative ATPase [Myxococcota bacterium]
MELPRRFGRFWLLAVLGEGGMGRVYRARMEGPDGFEKVVALKVIAAGGDDASRRRAIVREARLGARVAHPNLVDVYDFGVHEGQPWVAMELVDGLSLEAFLAGRGPLPEVDARDLLVQVLRGLDALHRAVSPEAPGGLVHLDLKPANVMLHPAGLAKITDLGLARAAGHGARRPTGTPAYMAPEQALGRPVDGRSDLYAWGSIAWEVLTGARFRRVTNFTELRAAVRTTEPITAKHRAALSARAPGLAESVFACLAPDPSDRPGSAAELLAQLDGTSGSAWASAGTVSGTPTVSADTLWSGEWDVPTGSAPTVGHRPPPPPDDLVGREHLLAELSEAVALGARCVTLHGPAGAGKSAVADAFALEAASRFAGGVWYADVAGSRSTDAALAAVAAAIGAVAHGAEPVAAVGTALAGLGRALLVVDGADAVATGLADLLEAWRPRAPDLAVVVTSRVLLQIEDHVVTVGPLPLPEPGDPDLAANPAVRLLVLRAQRARPTWRPTPADLPILATLAARLDGLPLALEIAASRLAVVSPRALLRRIDGALDLEGRGRGAVSLRAALDASWALLTPWAREALAQATVFRGGFDAEAAEAVLDLSAHADAPWAGDVLQDLTEQAWLQTLPGDPPRFALLGSVRAYAAEHLADAGGARARHLAWFGGPELEARVADAAGVAGAEALSSLIADRDELVAAVEEAIRQDRPAAAATAARGLGTTLEQLGPPAWVERVLLAVLELAGHSPRDRSDLLRLVGTARTHIGRYDSADAAMREAEAAARTAGDDIAAGLAMLERGRNWLQVKPNAEVATMLREARAALASDPVHAAHAQAQLATAVLGAGQLQEGIGLLRDAVGVLEQHAPASRVAMHQLNLGLALDLVGRRDTAARVLREADALARRAGSPRAEAAAASLLAARALQQGELERATDIARRAVSRARRAGEATSLSWAHRCRAEIAIARGELEEARVSLAEAVRVLGPEPATLHRAMADHTSGHWYLAAGEPDSAVDAFVSALAQLETLGERTKVRLVTSHLVLAHWWRGDTYAAEGALDALEAQDVGATGDQDAAWEALARLAVRPGSPVAEAVGRAGDPQLRGWAALLSHEPEGLAEARAVVDGLGVGPDSLLAQAVRRAADGPVLPPPA